MDKISYKKPTKIREHIFSAYIETYDLFWYNMKVQLVGLQIPQSLHKGVVHMSNETYNVIMCLLALLTFIVLLIDKIKK